MLRIDKTWRRPFYWGIAAWIICTFPSCAFVAGAPLVTMTWLAASFFYFITAFVFGHFRPRPSSFEKQLVTAGPMLLCVGNVFAWFLWVS